MATIILIINSYRERELPSVIPDGELNNEKPGMLRVHTVFLFLNLFEQVQRLQNKKPVALRVRAFRCSESGN